MAWDTRIEYDKTIILDSAGVPICTIDNPKVARTIIKAVNNHERLLTALAEAGCLDGQHRDIYERRQIAIKAIREVGS